jgi:hypothetical protein
MRRLALLAFFAFANALTVSAKPKALVDQVSQAGKSRQIMGNSFKSFIGFAFRFQAGRL